MRMIKKLIFYLEFIYFYKLMKINKNIKKPKFNKDEIEKIYHDSNEKLLNNDIKILPYLDKSRLNYQQIELETNYLMRNDKFFIRCEILKLCEFGLDYLKKYYQDSHYFIIREQNTKKWKVALKIFKYYKLFNSIKNKGYLPSLGYESDYPLVFMSKNYFRRLDGAHRVSVLRYLGYEKIKVNVITPQEALRLNNLPNKIRTQLIKMEHIVL